MSFEASNCGQFYGRVKTAFAKSLPIIALGLVNLLTFLPHYLGRMTFPWDFLAGYHAHSYAWYKYGSVLSPPAWFPWSDMGFPAFLAIQSGAWYLPLVILDTLGVDYTIHVATSFQALHVFAGAVGAYFLFRRYGFCAWIAFLGALAYHFTAAFYSGQQFVDIVRAAALLPWLWLSFHPDFIRKSWISPVLTSLILWQFLVAAYPGNIVSTAYGSVVVCLVAVAGISGYRGRMLYLSLIGSSVVAALMMAMIKWYPIIAERSQLDYGVASQSVLEWKLLATIFLPYDVDLFPGDVSMRSLWLPLLMLLGASFARLRTSAERVGAGLVGLTLFMSMIVPALPFLMDVLPGVRTSRFLVSDWRPILQLGLIFLALSGWVRVLAAEYSQVAVLVRSAAVGTFSILLVYGAETLGYPASGLLRPLATIAAMLIVGAGVGYLVQDEAGLARTRKWVIALICLSVAGEAALHQFGQPRTWREPWSQATEVLTYGGTVEGLAGNQIAGSDVLRRPGRYAFGATPGDALRDRRSLAYNRCWYSSTYCVLGYNNLKMSAPHKRFASALAEEGSEELLAFARRPQQLLVLPLDGSDRVRGLTGDNIESNAIGENLEGVSVDFLEYSPSRVIYRIETPRPILIVENEIWWSGWNVSYCDETGCSKPTASRQSPQGLRSWTLEKGTWEVVLEYRNAHGSTGYRLFFLGLVLSILLPLFVLRILGREDCRVST